MKTKYITMKDIYTVGTYVTLKDDPGVVGRVAHWTGWHDNINYSQKEINHLPACDRPLSNMTYVIIIGDFEKALSVWHGDIRETTVEYMKKNKKKNVDDL